MNCEGGGCSELFCFQEESGTCFGAHPLGSRPFSDEQLISSLLIALLAFGLVLRLGYLQVYSGPDLLNRALAQRHSPVPLLPNRGTI